jgi:hypothetical protein
VQPTAAAASAAVRVPAGNCAMYPGARLREARRGHALPIPLQQFQASFGIRARMGPAILIYDFRAIYPLR